MKWSWEIGSFSGIQLKIHSTFLLIIVWVVYNHISKGDDISATLVGVIFVLALFACVVLHEFGHALTARRYGIKTKDITLLPIGGIARLEKMPDDPKQELWVALAGPAVNVVIALLIFGLLNITSQPVQFEDFEMASASFLINLMLLNIILVVFNMLPAFPMDGGRVLRALLAMRMKYLKATVIASKIGQGMAVFFALIGIFYNPFLIIIALFVWLGAAQEANMVRMKTSLWNITVERAMITDYKTLSPVDTLSRAVNLVLSGSQEDFPVVENNNLVGMVRKNDLLLALSRGDINEYVKNIMKTDVHIASPDEYIDRAILILQNKDLKTIPVVKSGALVGLLTRDNISEFLLIQDALSYDKRN
jgi:Zn-dependent protease/predicted transcriptional regulator